VAVAVAHF